MNRLAAVANAILVFVTFLASVPAILMPSARGWLKLHGYLVVVCAVVSLVIGLTLWLDTLRTRSNLSAVWALQTPTVQSLLQQKVRKGVKNLDLTIADSIVVEVLWLLE